MQKPVIEYAFYTAIADNKNAGEVMAKNKLRESAILLFVFFSLSVNFTLTSAASSSKWSAVTRKSTAIRPALSKASKHRLESGSKNRELEQEF